MSRGICSVSEGVDSTGVPIVACDCSVPKCLNGTAPLDSRGRSLSCELNKFDHMMAVTRSREPPKRDPHFRYVFVGRGNRP